MNTTLQYVRRRRDEFFDCIERIDKDELDSSILFLLSNLIGLLKSNRIVYKMLLNHFIGRTFLNRLLTPFQSFAEKYDGSCALDEAIQNAPAARRRELAFAFYKWAEIASFNCIFIGPFFRNFVLSSYSRRLNRLSGAVHTEGDNTAAHRHTSDDISGNIAASERYSHQSTGSESHAISGNLNDEMAVEENIIVLRKLLTTRDKDALSKEQDVQSSLDLNAFRATGTNS